jgi:hypothetical protein
MLKKTFLALTSALLLFGVLTFTLTSQSQTSLTYREILNRVWDRTNHRLLATPQVTAQTGTFGTETEIWNDVFDTVNNKVRMSGAVPIYDSTETLPTPCVTGDIAGVPGTASLFTCDSNTVWQVLVQGSSSGTVQTTGIRTSATDILSSKPAVRLVSGNVALDIDNVLCIDPGTTGSAVTLPSAATATAGEYWIYICTDVTGTVTLIPNGTDKINGVNTSQSITGLHSYFHVKLLQSAATEWLVAKSVNDTLLGPNLPSCIQSGGDVNNASSGSGSYFNHSLSCTVPTALMTAKAYLDVCHAFTLVTGSTAPTIQFQLRAGSVQIAESPTLAPGNNVTANTITVCFTVLFDAAQSASTNTFSQVTGWTNIKVQPVAVATNADVAFTVGTKWSGAGTGTQTATQRFTTYRIFR